MNRVTHSYTKATRILALLLVGLLLLPMTALAAEDSDPDIGDNTETQINTNGAGTENAPNPNPNDDNNADFSIMGVGTTDPDDDDDDTDDAEAWYSVAGAGTESKPYEIGTMDELAYLAMLVNAGTDDFAGKFIKLTADIDLATFSADDGGGWVPIGTVTSGYYFKGTFDGNNHIVSNLKIRRNANNQGLFGFIQNSTIKNIGVVNADIDVGGDAQYASAAYVGGIVGQPSSNVTITNCFVSGKIAGGAYVGGIVGYGNFGGEISNCYSTADVKTKATGDGDYAGGIAGMTFVPVTNCYATGTVTSAKGGAGGLGGYSGKVMNSAALNQSVTYVKGADHGRILGDVYDGDLSGTIAWDGMTLNGSVPTTLNADRDGASKTADDIFKAQTWTDMGFTSANWTVEDGKPPILTSFAADVQISAYPSYLGTPGTTDPDDDDDDTDDAEAWYSVAGAGTESKPYEIGTMDELAYLAMLVNAGTDDFAGKFIKLTADIDLATFSADDGGGWVPIGTTASGYWFQGTFDGDGYIIENLHISRTGQTIDFVGLFGRAINAKIRNLGVINADVSGVTAGIISGGGGIIENCFTTGKVTGTAVAGGIVGSTGNNISNCYSTADITSASTADAYVGRSGGIVGAASLAGVATYSGLYSTGVVIGGGGILGDLTYEGRTAKGIVALNPSIDPTSAIIQVTRIMNTDYYTKTLQRLFAWDNMLVNGEKLTHGSKGTGRDHICDKIEGDGNAVHGENVNAYQIYSSEVWGTEYASFSTTVWTIEKGKLPILTIFEKHNDERNGVSVQPGTIPAHIMADLKDCEVTAVTVPAGAVISGTNITANVANNVEELTVAVTVSDLATWTLYSDANCNTEITDKKVTLAVGDNLVYIKVVAHNNDSKIYKLTITRSNADSQSTPPTIAAVTVPAGATISGTKITANVAYSISSITVNVTVSANATWKLFSDKDCNNEIANKTISISAGGSRTVYIKVVNGNLDTVYELIVGRANDGSGGGTGGNTGGGTGGGGGYIPPTTVDTAITDDNDFTDIEDDDTPSSSANAISIDEITDVSKNDWYYDGVKYALDNKLMNGVGGGEFAPNLDLSREMLITILYRQAGEPEVRGRSGYADVKDGEWYSDPIAWAKEIGIIDGYGNNIFGTGDDVTREQFALILYNFAKWIGIDVSASTDLDGYTDADKVSDWALDATRWANAMGLITGRDEKVLAPDGTATRAEAAVILQRFIENVLK